MGVAPNQVGNAENGPERLLGVSVVKVPKSNKEFTKARTLSQLHAVNAW
jgi:hypothetical protein